VGELFAQAGTYIVLDTNNARMSNVVWLEMRAIQVKEIPEPVETNQGASGIDTDSIKGSTEPPSSPTESSSKSFTPELPTRPFIESPSKPFTTEAPSRPFELGRPPNKGLEWWKLLRPPL